MRDAIVFIQDLLPQPWLTRTFGRMARSRRPWLRQLLIWLWMRFFAVSLKDAARTAMADYASFEDFFTRELRPGARRQPADSRALAAPADGYLREFGVVRSGRLLQAKGIDYPLARLLADDDLAAELQDGWFATIYLSPADYHRVHAPCNATLISVSEIPGAAYSVTRRTESTLPDLYCRNERLACRFETPVGPMAFVMVGAMLVTGIQAVWREPTPIAEYRATRHSLEFSRGAEIGRFTLGSTVVIVLPNACLTPEPTLSRNQRIIVGDALGILRQV